MFININFNFTLLFFFFPFLLEIQKERGYEDKVKTMVCRPFTMIFLAATHRQRGGAAGC